MTERGKIFCREYALNPNKTGAAIKAGYDPLYARDTAERLLKKPEVREEIARRKKEAEDGPSLAEELSVQLEQALCQIAFSGDSAALQAMRLTPKDGRRELDGINLLRVSEISLSGDGKITVKFIDRFKAFQMLAELAERKRADGGGGSLSAAIRESIAAVNGLPFREGGGENGNGGD